MNQPLHIFANAYRLSLLAQHAQPFVAGQHFVLPLRTDWLPLMDRLGDLLILAGEQLKDRVACAELTQGRA